MCETLRANFEVNSYTQRWPRALKELWKLRSNEDGGLTHPRTIAPAPAPFPPHLPAPARMTYTFDNAARSVALMAEIFTACDGPAVRPGLDELRRFIEVDLRTYRDEFARRGPA